MQLKFTKALLLLTLSGMLFSCGGEDLDDMMEPEFKSSNLTADISSSDLLGKWVIDSMEADQEVNFNGDAVSSTDILSETSCFEDMMYYEFRADETVKTGQAKLSFHSSGNFTCDKGEYYATYEVNGDILSVKFNFSGSTVTENKQIRLSSDEKWDYLHVTLDEIEAAAYVNDPGDTNSSHIGFIEMTYKKEKI